MCHSDKEKGEKRNKEIELSNQESIRTLGEKEKYKDFRTLEADTIK